MDYPENFDTPAFPAGKRIAVSRTMGIGILVSFLLIICTCGLLLWGVHSVRQTPFLVSIDKITGGWSVIGRSITRLPEYSVTYTMQESVIGNFAQNWFFISDAESNDAVWKKSPASYECTGAEAMAHTNRTYAISCGASDDLYSEFINNVMPDYALRAGAGETWYLMTDVMKITPIGRVGENGGTWQLVGSVWSNINNKFDVVAFVRLGRDLTKYKMTMGYYVADFNAYRIN